MAAALASIREIEREVAALRIAPGSDVPFQRTSVMTHTAWVARVGGGGGRRPLRAGRAPPSRTIVLVPEPDREDGLEAQVDVEVFPSGEDARSVPRRSGSGWGQARVGAGQRRAAALPAGSAGLPPWRGVPAFGGDSFESLVDVVDRLIVDSTEWPELPGAMRNSSASSTVSWSRTSPGHGRAAGAGSSRPSGPGSGTSSGFASPAPPRRRSCCGLAVFPPGPHRCSSSTSRPTI